MDDLVTARLVLHALGVAEAERVAAGEPDRRDTWAPGYPSDGDRAVARRYLRNCAVTGDPSPFGAYGIRRRANGPTIGGAGFLSAPDEDFSVRIGYGLVPSARGRGYASEALRALLDLARDRGVAQVNGDAGRDDIPSQRVMIAAGMRLVSEDEDSKRYRVTFSSADAPRPGSGGRVVARSFDPIGERRG